MEFGCIANHYTAETVLQLEGDTGFGVSKISIEADAWNAAMLSDDDMVVGMAGNIHLQCISRQRPWPERELTRRRVR